MGKKKHYKYICTSTFANGKKEEFVKWYTSQHFHDILSIPGVSGVQFFGQTRAQFREIDRPHPYVVIWDIYTDDPDKLFETMRRNGQNGTTVFSDAFGDWYDIAIEPLSEYVTQEEARGKSVEEVYRMSRGADCRQD